MADVLAIGVHCIHDNIAGDFEMLDEVDLHTGQLKIRTIARITNPGDWASFPEETAKELLAAGAIRLPTEQELALRRYAGGSDV